MVVPLFQPPVLESVRSKARIVCRTQHSSHIGYLKYCLLLPIFERRKVESSVERGNMTEEERERYYWDLEERYERGDIRPDEPGKNALYGAEAEAEGRKMLMWATNTDTIEDAVASALAHAQMTRVGSTVAS